tara:strand:+ start:87 stop:419 length:333 start_codon:yes stop_codon:yes gene_type:complete
MIYADKLREKLAEEKEGVELLLESISFKTVVRRIVSQVLESSLSSRYDPDEFITRKELAKRWSIHVNTVSNFHNREKYKPTIYYYRFGKSTSYKWSDCLEFARANFLTKD